METTLGLVRRPEGCFLGDINLHQVGLIPRILLTANGTLTHILESCFLELIEVQKVMQGTELMPFNESYLQVPEPENLLVRRILLRGEESRRHYIYAESFVFCDRVSESVRQQLTHTDTPIGKVLNQHGIESFKRFVDYRCEPAGKLGEYFGMQATDSLFSRTFLVFSEHRPIMVITEKIPPLEPC
ncbi:chorismate--pyruvate lyase family protein [Gynuella sunshinyii]|uniref:4-hydroxybenzoate synthetase (Chorismate lyase) n=1 Tax=Gynuella sunshinyii YC6258 TaxID=1445510 RepID=A0A0C5VFD1_9GAMM|nr:chorismate pyruvate-lyase family protein [Gynuella sunshinyii]AJQ92876.1 4-hydroxybenzoate synthetase (chorismate lyase) [Gynuella sunshinyii YC6258]